MTKTGWAVRAFYAQDGYRSHRYPWVSQRNNGGGYLFRTWKEAMDYANVHAEVILRDRHDRRIAQENGWPALAGLDYQGRFSREESDD